MNKSGNTKVVIIGAGYVGASTAFALSMRQACSEIVLVDINREKALGEVDDLKHGMPFIGPTRIYHGDYSCVRDSDVVIITAGENRKPGETRFDLARKNTEICYNIANHMVEYFNSGVLLVVTNPVDIITLLFSKWLKVPHSRIIGSGTILDTVRLRSVLSDYTSVDVGDVNALVIGEHGDTQVPLWSCTSISGTNIKEYCKRSDIEFNQTVMSSISDKVKKMGASVISRKGATYYGIASCVSELVKSILLDLNSVYTLSSVLDGRLNVRDVSISLPVALGREGISRVITPGVSIEEAEAFRQSANMCMKVVHDLKDYL